MSDEKSTGTVPSETVTIPAAEYQSLKSDALRCYGQAETAGREAAALRADRDAESITRVVRAAAEAAGVRPEALGDVVVVVGPGLRVENGEVRPRRVWPST
jgi:hypothetical protein